MLSVVMPGEDTTGAGMVGGEGVSGYGASVSRTTVNSDWVGCRMLQEIDPNKKRSKKRYLFIRFVRPF
jgi:hypothetical protein